MKAIQLELDFKSAIAQALAEPEVADLRQLWRSLEPELLGLTQKEQLQVAGQALCDLAEVCQRRAELMWNEWQDSHNTEGPISDDDFLAGLVQKTMFLDISGLVRQPKSRKATVDDVEEESDSVVEEVTKEVALLLAGAEDEEEPLPVMVLEHDEDVGAWAAIVREWMVSVGVEYGSISEIVNSTQLSAVKVWLSALLSDFKLERMSHKDKDFYDAEQLIIRTETFARCEVA
jgi:hypothetical protein